MQTATRKAGESYANARVVVSLRPAGDHAPMRRAAAARGWRVLALSPWRIATRDDDDTLAALSQALRAEVIVVTSPAAVRAARAHTALHAPHARAWCAVGTATAAALRRAGVAHVHVPTRMDSEGLLALDVLQDVRGQTVGVLTAPGGRDRIAPALRERGARVVRADVYAREPIAPGARTLAALRASPQGWLVPVSSAEALERTLAALPDDLGARLRAATVLAASERIATIARALGCSDIRIAPGPRPAQLLAAAG